MEKLEEVAKHTYKKFKSSVPMIFDKVAEELYKSQSECYACGDHEKFSSEKQSLRKVRDHCHNTEKYRGALHSKCNLRLRRSRTIPVFFHNLTSNDCHIFVKRQTDTPGDVNCIARKRKNI